MEFGTHLQNSDNAAVLFQHTLLKPFYDWAVTQASKEGDVHITVVARVALVENTKDTATIEDATKWITVPGVSVPEERIGDKGTITFNLNPSKLTQYKSEDNKVTFGISINGLHRSVVLPITSIIAVWAKRLDNSVGSYVEIPSNYSVSVEKAFQSHTNKMLGIDEKKPDNKPNLRLV